MIAIEGVTDGEAVQTEVAVIVAEVEAVVAVESGGNVETGIVETIVADRDHAADPESRPAQAVDDPEMNVVWRPRIIAEILKI